MSLMTMMQSALSNIEFDRIKTTSTSGYYASVRGQSYTMDFKQKQFVLEKDDYVQFYHYDNGKGSGQTKHGTLLLESTSFSYTLNEDAYYMNTADLSVDNVIENWFPKMTFIAAGTKMKWSYQDVKDLIFVFNQKKDTVL